MEYSKLGLEHFTPDYTRYFHALPEATRDRAAAHPVAALQGHRRRHHRRDPRRALPAHRARRPTRRCRCSPTPRSASLEPAGGAAAGRTPAGEQGTRLHRSTADAVVLATGYRGRPIAGLPRRAGRPASTGTRPAAPGSTSTTGWPPTRGSPATLYVQNAELHTHGVGAPDLGLGAHRSATIVNAAQRPGGLPAARAHRLHRLRRRLTMDTRTAAASAVLTGDRWDRHRPGADRQDAGRVRLRGAAGRRAGGRRPGRLRRWSCPAGSPTASGPRRRLFDGWRVDRGLGACAATAHGEAPATDAGRLLLDLRDGRRGRPAATAAHLIRELRATQVADCHLAAGGRHRRRPAGPGPPGSSRARWAGTPGSPPTRAASGSATPTTCAYAPERRGPGAAALDGRPHRLASYQAVPGLPDDRLLAGELDPDTAAASRPPWPPPAADPGDYRLVARPPLAVGARWSCPLFAAAHRRRRHRPPRPRGPTVPAAAVHPHPDQRQPPRRGHHLKLPLSHPQHPGLARPAHRAHPRRPRASPRGSHGLRGRRPVPARRVRRDPARRGRHPSPSSTPSTRPLPEVPYQYRELLGCDLARAAGGQLAPGERARTLASLLHTRPPRATPFAAELVARSGLAAGGLARGGSSTPLLPPLLHFLYRYGTVFSPARRERHRRLRRRGRARAAGGQGLRRRRQRRPTSRCPSWPRPCPRGRRGPADRGARVPHPVHLGRRCSSGSSATSPPCARNNWASASGASGRWYGPDRARLPGRASPSWRTASRPSTCWRPAYRASLCLNRNRLLTDGYRDRPERPHAAVHGTVPNALDEVAEP